MCEYCKKTEDENHPIMFEVGEDGELKDKMSIICNGKIFALRYKNKYEKLSEVVKINYCPMCGRELKEE